MADGMTDMLRIAWHGGWPAGPLLDKELRITSRQWRHYLLRFGYVGLLVAAIVLFWHSIVRVGGGGSTVAQVSRLGETGRRVIVTIVWFQFIAAQILATVLLADAISSEVRRRTLEDLLVTPMRAIHIVLGKLLSRLLQVLLLVLVSLPVLAVVRVFGGVPWDYVVAGVAITVSASLFAGSLSLLCSILYRHAYHAVLIAGCWYLLLWGLDAFVLLVLPRTNYLNNPAGAFLWSLICPFHALYVRSQTVLTGPLPANPCASLGLHCLTVLLAAGVILILSARRIRRVASAAPQAGTDDRTGYVTDLPAEVWTGVQHAWAEQAIRRVKGSPIVWKDLERPLFQTQGRAWLELGLWPLAAVLAMTLVALAKPATYGSFFFVILIVQGVFILRLGLVATGAITREKEARTWPILLTTPLDNGAIVRGKALAALRRNLLFLAALLVFYFLAFQFGRPGEQDLSHLLQIVGVPTAHLLGTTLFLLGGGLYAGVRCRTTAAALAWTLGIYVLSKLAFSVPLTIDPGLLPGFLYTGNSEDRIISVYAALFAAVYACYGLFCLRAAARRLRRNVFG